MPDVHNSTGQIQLSATGSPCGLRYEYRVKGEFLSPYEISTPRERIRATVGSLCGWMKSLYSRASPRWPECELAVKSTVKIGDNAQGYDRFLYIFVLVFFMGPRAFSPIRAILSIITAALRAPCDTE